MASRSSVALFVGATIAAAGVSLGAAKSSMRSPEYTEPLFRGDMTAETRVGCSTGTNESATKVTANGIPTFGVVSTTYSIAGHSGPTWDLVAWKNGASPGTEIDKCPLGAANGTPGNHTVAVPLSCLLIKVQTGQTFFFGLSQRHSMKRMAFAMDTSGSTPGTVFYRSPSCGLSNFVTVESIGFPGYWVQRIIVSDKLAEELMDFGVN